MSDQSKKGPEIDEKSNAESSAPINTLTIETASGLFKVDVFSDEDASTLASKINSISNITNVTARAETAMVLYNLRVENNSGAYSVSFDLYGDNLEPVSIRANIATSSDFEELISAINAKNSSTGISAEMFGNNNAIVLKYIAGKGIKIANFSCYNSAGTIKEVTIDVETNGTFNSCSNKTHTLKSGGTCEENHISVSGARAIQFSASEEFEVYFGTVSKQHSDLLTQFDTSKSEYVERTKQDVLLSCEELLSQLAKDLMACYTAKCINMQNAYVMSSARAQKIFREWERMLLAGLKNFLTTNKVDVSMDQINSLWRYFTARIEQGFVPNKLELIWDECGKWRNLSVSKIKLKSGC